MRIGLNQIDHGANGRHSRRCRKALGLMVSSVAMCWVGVLLWGTVPELARGLSQVNLKLLLLGFVLVAFATGMVFEAFRPIVRISGISGLSSTQLGHLYFTAQLLRHLPGRVWGIGYQIAGGRFAGSVGSWLSANVLHMSLAIYFALLIAVSIISYSKGLWLSVLTGSAGLLLFIAVLRIFRSRWFLSQATNRGGRLAAIFGMVIDCARRAGRRDLSHAVMAIGASWIGMYTAWAFFASAYPDLDAIDGLRLLALYMIAWFAGYASIVTPGGLGVREVVFVSLANEYGTDAVAYLAIVGRLSLLSGDFVLGLAFMPFAPMRKAPTDS